MFGLERNKQATTVFQFPLEEELITPDGKERYLLHVRAQVAALRALLTQGTPHGVFKDLHLLLDGYQAVALVLAKMCEKK